MTLRDTYKAVKSGAATGVDKAPLFSNMILREVAPFVPVDAIEFNLPCRVLIAY